MEEQRAALGRTAQIGDFYNVRNDQFLVEAGTALFLKDQPDLAVTRYDESTVEISFKDSYAQRFDMHNVQPQLAASIVSGLVKPEAFAAYLGTGLDGTHDLMASLVHTFHTVEEHMEHESLRKCVNVAKVWSNEATDATHVVSGISWGVMSRLVLESGAAPSAVDAPETEDVFQRHVQLIKQRFEGKAPSPTAEDALETSWQGFSQIHMDSDNLDGTGIIMSSVDEALNFLRLVPMEVKHKHQGIGVPLTYHLVSVDFFRGRARLRKSVAPAPAHIFSTSVDLFDQLEGLRTNLESQKSFLSSHGNYVKDDHRLDVLNAIDALRATTFSLKTRIGKAICDARSNPPSVSALDRLHSEAASKAKEFEHVLAESQKHEARLSFIASAVRKGAVYVGERSTSSNTKDSPSSEPFHVMFLSASDIQSGSQCWQDHQALLNKLLDNKADPPVVFLADGSEENTRMALHHGGQEVCRDMLDREQSLAGKCFAECPEDKLETRDIQRPLQRRLVNVACPGPSCDEHQQHQWLCSRCGAMLEFGFTDQYMYCDCGRSDYQNFRFRCHQHDEPGYASYEPQVLKVLLESLDVPDNVNILILGETGVGKSTFINAFVNYIAHDTLEEALKHDLTSVIPCSFNIQEVNKSKSTGEIKEHRIDVGSQADEQDGSTGQSATQVTQVYPIVVGTRTIRLIDTPGVGDTRGLAFDKKNMADILRTLQSYDGLHGIIILLKSSQSRLTVTFNFCLKELLTHLHRSATESMVFGFTSTRVTNYTPGDTFGPLKTLLAREKNAGLHLRHETTYCFDSEAFRYLAAYKSGHEMENFEDFRRSWEQSHKETQRLITHFTSKPPHRVRDMLGLNRARQLIQELTKPMADVSQVIQQNLAAAKDQTKDLDNHRLTGADLRKRLWLSRVQYQAVKLPKPRTVCKNAACLEVKDDGTGEKRVVTIFKTHCHDECYLKDVHVDQVAHPGLKSCAAFSGQDECHKCTHHWQEHMHVLYELKETTATIQDTAIQKQLASNITDDELRKQGIKRLNSTIAEFQAEQDQIRKAAAYFCLFLKTHCITPYNDATLDYLDMHIKDEQSKIAAAQQSGLAADGNRRKLASLEEDRKRHEELVKTMTENLQSSPGNYVLTEAEVDGKIQELYQLKHFGKQLEDIKNTVVSAHDATYRERPVVVKDAVRGRSGPGHNAYLAAVTRNTSPQKKKGTVAKVTAWLNWK